MSLSKERATMTVLLPDTNHQSTVREGQMEVGLRMNSEFKRLASFINFPESSNARPIALARAGFYKPDDSQMSDKVTCFSCCINISNWQPHDVPIEEHRKHSPNCTFLSSRQNGVIDANIPMNAPDMSLREAYAALKGIPSTGEIPDEDRSSVSHQGPQCIAVPSSTILTQTAYAPLQQNGAHNILPGQPTVPEPSRSDSQTSITGDGGDLDIVQAAIKRVPSIHKLSQINPLPSSTDPCKQDDFAFMDRMRSEKERRSTFYDWPQGAWHHPTALAAAGFFYTGSADRVQCAFCRGIICNWKLSEIPMEEHHKHFPDCPFVHENNIGNIPVAPANPQSAAGDQGREVQGNNSLEKVTQRARNPDSAIDATTVATFNHPAWPSSLKQSPARLGQAGVNYADGDLSRVGSFLDSILFLEDHASFVNNGKIKRQQSDPTTSAGDGGQTNKKKKKENEDMKPQWMQEVCMDKEANTVSLPCADLMCCASFSTALKNCHSIWRLAHIINLGVRYTFATFALVKETQKWLIELPSD